MNRQLSRLKGWPDDGDSAGDRNLAPNHTLAQSRPSGRGHSPTREAAVARLRIQMNPAFSFVQRARDKAAGEVLGVCWASRA